MSFEALLKLLTFSLFVWHVALVLPQFSVRLLSLLKQFDYTVINLTHKNRFFFSAEERDQCVTLRGNLERRYKHTEDELASLHVRLEQQMDFKKKNEELEDSITVCKSELDSLNKLDATKTATLETLRLEKDTINTQLDVKRDENKKLQEEVDRVRVFYFLRPR